MLNQIPIRLLILCALMLFLWGCKDSNDEKQVPTLTPTVASDALDKAFTNGVEPVATEEMTAVDSLPDDVIVAEEDGTDIVNPSLDEGITEEEPVEIGESDLLPTNPATTIVLENGDTITTDPALFVTYEYESIGLRLQHPPEIQNSPPQLEEDGIFNFLVNGNFMIDTAAGIYDSTGMSVIIFNKTQSELLAEVDVDDPSSVLETWLITPFESDEGFEIVQPIAPVNINGHTGASTLLHFFPFPGSQLQQTVYGVVLLDGDWVIGFKGEATLADEAVMKPIFDEMIQSFVLEDLE